jgi:hypothetical protein
MVAVLLARPTLLFVGTLAAGEPSPPSVVPVTTDGVMKTRHTWSSDGKTLVYVKLSGSTMGSSCARPTVESGG